MYYIDFLQEQPLLKRKRLFAIGWLNISKYHLSREFTRCTGESIHQYLIRIRVNQAKILLKETTLSVEEIAYQVGIHHASHFIQLFREREGMTPLEFRKHWASVVER